ncbi:hypothetical protein [Burkholderia sp. L27(2015)]
MKRCACRPSPPRHRLAAI